MITLLLIFCSLFVLSYFETTPAKHKDDRDPSANRLPYSISIIIPLTGYSDTLQNELLSICNQTCYCQNIICVTENNDDTAVPVINKLTTLDSRVVHICAGRATSCSQKNHNLLTGYHYAKNNCEILVFCDAGHMAPSHWLYNLLSPLLLDSSITVSSGYHHVCPGQSSSAIYCRAVCVAALHLFRRIPCISQPWGGATAIRVSDFHAMNVAENWSTTIVDDVVLAYLLKMQGKKLAIPVDADTRTYIKSPTFTSMNQWLTRQIAYLKFVFPKTWLTIGIALFFNSFGFFSALLISAFSQFFILSQPAIIISVSYLLLYFLFSLTLRLYHPCPGSAIRWYGACILCSFLPCWCFALTALTSKIYWGDTVYSVAKHGKVVRLEKLRSREMIKI